MLPPAVAWQRLTLMQEVLLDRPDLARAARRLPLADLLSLTLELLNDGQEPRPPPAERERLPPNVVPFRPRLH